MKSCELDLQQCVGLRPLGASSAPQTEKSPISETKRPHGSRFRDAPVIINPGACNPSGVAPCEPRGHYRGDSSSLTPSPSRSAGLEGRGVKTPRLYLETTTDNDDSPCSAACPAGFLRFGRSYLPRIFGERAHRHVRRRQSTRPPRNSQIRSFSASQPSRREWLFLVDWHGIALHYSRGARNSICGADIGGLDPPLA